MSDVETINFIFVVLKMHENQEKKSIRELPNEILLTIFSYLHTHDVKYNIANVCVQWSMLAKDKKLWKHLDFKTTNKITKTFGVSSWYSTLKFLENTPELHNVTISQGHSDEEVGEILKSLNDYCPNLRHIDFDMDFGTVAKLLKNFDRLFNNVESLKLTLTSNSQAGVFKAILNFKKLKKIIILGANPEINGFRLVLRDSPDLEHVNVAGVDLSKINFMSLWKSNDKFSSLGMKIDNLDESCLKFLVTFPKLKELVITDGNSSPGKLKNIGKIKCLTKLHLLEAASSPVLTASALTDFFQDGCFLNLRELKLHQSRLNDEGAAEIRRKCVNLVYLEVMTYPRSLSSLSEKALVHFLHCKRLEHFEILFDNSEETDWNYRRKRHVRHECDIDKVCPISLEELLDSWDEIQIPVD